MTDDKMTEHEEAVLGASTLAVAAEVPEEVIAGMMAMFDAYRAMVSVLLHEDGSERALEYLRGLARMGIDQPPAPEDALATRTQERVMEVLAFAGVEPYTSAEVNAQLRAAAQSIIHRVDEGTTRLS